MERVPAAEDVAELSKQGYFTILLGENLRALETALEDDGFKVVVPPQVRADEALKRMARGWAILTKNSHDFIDDAVRPTMTSSELKKSNSWTEKKTVQTKQFARFRPLSAAAS